MRAKRPRRSLPCACIMVALCAAVQGCSGSNGPNSTQGAADTGGSSGSGGAIGPAATANRGGTSAAGGAPSMGGATSIGGSVGSSGTSSSIATSDTGGETSTGGKVGTGGTTAANGGKTGTGATTATGGATSTGGAAGTGGTPSSGSATATGGTATGGAAGSGVGGRDVGTTGGGSADGGKTGTGGATSAAGGAACAGSQPTPKTGDQTVTLQSGGRSRSYILHTPSGLTAGNPLALVIDLHGAGGNGKQQQGMSGFSSLADIEKFLVVFPDGIDGYWNVDDTCCGTAGKEKIDDVGFLKATIKKLSAETCIDAKRIYVSGFSNGGGLAHRMGCDAADVVAAIAPTATDLRTQPCNAARPISMMEVRGMADSLEPYGGGVVGPAGGQYTAVGAKQSLKLWADIDQCIGTTATINTYCESYTQCASGVEADLCSLPNTDHNSYSNSLGFKVASVAWNMFKRQPMK